MLKRTLLVISVALLVTAAIWLMPGQQTVELFPPGGSSGKPEVKAQREGVAKHEVVARQESVSEGGETGGTVPRSQRHSAGEIEKHRAIELRLKEIKQAVRDQEDRVEEKRKILAAIVRTKGIIYKGTDSTVVPPELTSETEATPEEKVALQEALNKKDAEERGRDAQDYVDAKRDFEADQEMLKQMQVKYDEERKRLEERGR